MKNIFNMKKLLSISVFLISMAFCFSCQTDESLDPLPTKVDGQFMKLEINPLKKELLLADINNTQFEGLLSNTSGTVVRYELFIRRRTAIGFLTSDYVPFRTITSFPNDLIITPADIAATFNIPVTDLQDSEVYGFLAYSYDAAGNKVGYSNLSRTVQTTPGLNQGYKFNTRMTLIPDAAGYNNHASNP
jgi:hypothetical protein